MELSLPIACLVSAILLKATALTRYRCHSSPGISVLCSLVFQQSKRSYEATKKEDQMAKSDVNSLEKYFEIGLFAFFVFTGALTGFIVSSPGIFGATSVVIVTVYMISVAMGWFAFSSRHGAVDFDRVTQILVVG